MSFEVVTKFENKLANFFGAPYAIAVDCCTHGVELCLRYKKVDFIKVQYKTSIDQISLKWIIKEKKVNQSQKDH